jgi:excisionase family DNA binding protein
VPCYDRDNPDGDPVAMVDKDEILLNSKEVAEILDLSPDTVNELARKSVLPAHKRGRQWRFCRRDIITYKRESWSATAA